MGLTGCQSSEGSQTGDPMFYHDRQPKNMERYCLMTKKNEEKMGPDLYLREEI